MGGKYGMLKTTIIGNKKDCSRCKKFKTLNEFVKTKGTKSGYAGICLSCNKDRVNEWVSKQDKHVFGEKRRQISKKWVEELKFEVISVYGPCYCCDENRIEFLTIDHIDGGGAKHRKEINMVGYRFYSWLKNNNYPKEFRTACANCNMAIRFGKTCPHKIGE